MTFAGRTTFGNIFGYSLVTAAITVVVIVLIAVINILYFNDPAIVVKSLDKPIAEPLCVGDIVEVHNSVTVKQPLLLFSYFSVMDDRQNHNVNNTQVGMGARTHPHPSTFTQTLTWIVPDIPPGKYSRVQAFRSTDGRENSIFLSTPFTVTAEGCE